MSLAPARGGEAVVGRLYSATRFPAAGSCPCYRGRAQVASDGAISALAATAWDGLAAALRLSSGLHRSVTFRCRDVARI